MSDLISYPYFQVRFNFDSEQAGYLLSRIRRNLQPKNDRATSETEPIISQVAKLIYLDQQPRNDEFWKS